FGLLLYLNLVFVADLNPTRLLIQFRSQGFSFPHQTAIESPSRLTLRFSNRRRRSLLQELWR
ncbi:hypothetical protein LINGRAPRIM_LOCUS3014, partial [Linum grandiflorum]